MMLRKFFSSRMQLPPDSPYNRARLSDAPAALRPTSFYSISPSVGLRLPPLQSLPSVRQPSPKQPHKKRFPLSCQCCNVPLRTRPELTAHLRSAHCKFVCEYCGKELGCKDTWRRHVKEAHERKRSLKCPVCENRFARGENLKRHFDSLHGLEEYWRCRCGEIFLELESLQKHKTEKNHRSERR